MFDIGFSELVLCGIVALLVIGPKQLPGLAQKAGLWVGRMRRFIGTVQADVNREIAKSEELTRLLAEQSKIKQVHEIIEQTVDDTRRSVSVNAAPPNYVVKAMPDAAPVASTAPAPTTPPAVLLNQTAPTPSVVPAPVPTAVTTGQPRHEPTQ